MRNFLYNIICSKISHYPLELPELGFLIPYNALEGGFLIPYSALGGGFLMPYSALTGGRREPNDGFLRFERFMAGSLL
jgi:hypothetical protein